MFRASNDLTGDITWDALVEAAYLARISLQAQRFHATPELYFDRQRGQGHPFAYHACGTSAIEVELDSLLGTYRILQVDVQPPKGPFNAKAIGEPPLLLGLGAGMALLEALRTCTPAYRPDYRFPVTPEHLLLALYPALAAQLMEVFSPTAQQA